MSTQPPKPPVTLLHEIKDQPDLFRDVLARQEGELGIVVLPGDQVLRIIALAEGSSRHAIEIAAPFLEEWTGLPLYIHNPESLEEKFTIARLFEEDMAADSATIYRNAFFLVISQSGETASVIRALSGLEEILTEGGMAGITVTNNEGSTLARHFNNHLHIGAGEEKSIAATKTFTASILTLLTWGLYVGLKRGRLSEESYRKIRRQLGRIPDRIQALWDPARMEAIFRFTQRLVEVNHFVLLSKGPLTLVLPEAGLKLTETSSNIVYTDNSESFKHGPKVILSGVNGLHPNSIYVVPTDHKLAEALYKDIRSHFWIDPFGPNEELAFEDDRVFFMTFENSPPVPLPIRTGLSVGAEMILNLPSSSTVESLFVAIVAFQLISYYLAVIKGENPDNPTLTKAVTD